MYQIIFILSLVLVVIFFGLLLPSWIFYKLGNKQGIKKTYIKYLGIYLGGSLISGIISAIIIAIGIISGSFLIDENNSTLGVFESILEFLTQVLCIGILLRFIWKSDYKKSFKLSFSATIIYMCILLPLFGIRYFLVSPYKVFGPSMEPTFIRGDVILTKKTNTYSRGDIVVTGKVGEKNNLIERVVGLPGETVKIESGKVIICNNSSICEELDELYLFNSNSTKIPVGDDVSKFTLENGYFLMGDNREKSLDSRWCFSNEGCIGGKNSEINKDDIKGKAYAKIWPEFKFIK